MNDAKAFIAVLPKAELHLHIEGTLEPEMTFALAERNAVSLPYRSVEELRAAYTFKNLQDFLDLYYASMAVLLHEQDFYELTYAYLEKAQKQCVRHAEIFFDPQAHHARGVAFGTVIDGIDRARREAARELNITSKVILCFLRDLDAANAMRTLDEAMDYRERIVGVGLDSAEIGHPPSKFEEVFARAREAGFLAVAHAGEEGPAAYVSEALDILKVSRIDHGVRSIEDDDLVERLAISRVPLTVCPLSNLELAVVNDMKDHPLATMLRRGLCVTVNSDDPSYFGGYVNENYAAVHQALGLTRGELVQLARNSFEASFLEPAEKATHLTEIDDYLGRP